MILFTCIRENETLLHMGMVTRSDLTNHAFYFYCHLIYYGFIRFYGAICDNAINSTAT